MTAPRGTLQAKLFLAFALVTVIAVALPAILSRSALYQDRLNLASRQALSQASVIKSVLDAGVNERQLEALLASVKTNGARLTIAAEDGTVIHDSHVGEDSLGAGASRHAGREAGRGRKAGGVVPRSGARRGPGAVFGAL